MARFRAINLPMTNTVKDLNLSILPLEYRVAFEAQAARVAVLEELTKRQVNQTGFTGERKAWKVSHDKRKFREPFFDRSAGARSAFGA